MILFIWLVSGSLIISTSFLTAYHFTSDYWFAGGVSSSLAGILLFTFLIYITRHPFPKKIRIRLILIYIVFAALLITGWQHQKNQGNWHKTALIAVKQSIDKDILKSYIYDVLLRTMYQYYQNDSLLTLKDAFEHKEPMELLAEYQKDAAIDSLVIYAAQVKNDTIVLVGQRNLFSGNNINFKNHNGRKGKMQFTGVLTIDGITYEQNN